MEQTVPAGRVMSDRLSDPRAAAGRKTTLRRSALGALAVAGLAAAAYYGTTYWQTGRFMVATDDAYVAADNTLIAPRVSGYISQVLVTDNQAVKAGQVLARIDDRDFQTALRQAVADDHAAESEINAIDAQLVLQSSTIEEANQQLASADAALEFAQQDHARYDKLFRAGAGTTQSAEQSESVFQQRTAGQLQARAALAAAKAQIGVLQASWVRATAQLEHYRAAEQQAGLNLGYTTITAPGDGTVGARSLRVGQYVQAGTQLMAVVPLDAVYIVANFKETQLTDVHPGQPVEIAVDTFPDAEIHGHVDSVSPATGLQFALLPPDNATGNFTKIVQRLPVKIVLDHNPAGHDAAAGLLRPGMSVEPTINTKEGAANTKYSAIGSVASR
jgi:membrane fusion protein (multidrug efflux system)